MRSAKVFKHGNSQAVLLPEDFRFDGDAVLVKRTATGVLLLPMKITCERLDAAPRPITGTIRAASAADADTSLDKIRAQLPFSVRLSERGSGAAAEDVFAPRGGGEQRRFREHVGHELEAERQA